MGGYQSFNGPTSREKQRQKQLEKREAEISARDLENKVDYVVHRIRLLPHGTFSIKDVEKMFKKERRALKLEERDRFTEMFQKKIAPTIKSFFTS